MCNLTADKSYLARIKVDTEEIVVGREVYFIPTCLGWERRVRLTKVLNICLHGDSQFYEVVFQKPKELSLESFRLMVTEALKRPLNNIRSEYVEGPKTRFDAWKQLFGLKAEVTEYLDEVVYVRTSNLTPARPCSEFLRSTDHAGKEG